MCAFYERPMHLLNGVVLSPMCAFYERPMHLLNGVVLIVQTSSEPIWLKGSRPLSQQGNVYTKHSLLSNAVI